MYHETSWIVIKNCSECEGSQSCHFLYNFTIEMFKRCARFSGQFEILVENTNTKFVLTTSPGTSYAMTLDQGGEQMVSFELYVSFLVLETQFCKFTCVSLL